MRYLNNRIIVAIIMNIFSWSLCRSDDTIIIKKYDKPSKAILNKKIIYMDMGARSSSPKPNSPSSLNQLSELQSNNSTKKDLKVKTPITINKIQSKNFKVNKLSKKHPDPIDTGIYNEEDWEEYTQYNEVFLEESLDVNAKLIQKQEN